MKRTVAEFKGYRGEKKLNPKFVKELEKLINRYCVENGSNTPDFILAHFLKSSLKAVEKTINDREKWYNR